MKKQVSVAFWFTLVTFVCGQSSDSLLGHSCAPGLDGHPCECRASEYRGLSKCERGRAYVRLSYWVGECENGTLCTGHCPFGFCAYNGSEQYRLPGTVHELDEYICGNSRTGVLCGKCRAGYSASYHSYSYACISNRGCSYGWVLYLVSEMLPLIVFFIIVIVFNVSFTSGAINSFVLFAQLQDGLAMLGDGRVYNFSVQHYFILVSEFVYRFFNFDFFSVEELSFCLWRGTTVLDVMAFKYVTILFGLILMFVCVYVMNSFRIKRCLPCLRPTTLRSSLIHGLSAFFVMCYSQCARVSFQILTPTYLYKEGEKYAKRVVYESGQLSMFEPVHLKYAIPAVIFSSTLLLLPPLVLIVYPLLGKALDLCKLGETKFANFISRIVPMQLLDSFQGSFKDEMRFFAGFFFLYRIIALASFTFSSSTLEFYCILEVCLIFTLALHAIVQPHKKKMHNVVDVLLFAALAVINVLSLLHYQKTALGSPNSPFIVISYILQIMLIYLPLICLLVAGLVKARRFMVSRRKKSKSKEEKLLDTNDLPPLREE